MREKIFLSACLAGELCRYDGEIDENHELMELIASHEYEYITACPEVAGGLPTPRPPAQIRGGDGREVLRGDSVITDETKRDVTENFITGAKKVLNLIKEHNIKKAVLNERSPSCGVRYIYKGELPVEGVGVLTAVLQENGIEVISDEDFIKSVKR